MSNDQPHMTIPPEIMRDAIREYLEKNISARALMLDPAIVEAKDSLLKALNAEKDDIDKRIGTTQTLTLEVAKKQQESELALTARLATLDALATQNENQLDTSKGQLANKVVEFQTVMQTTLNVEKERLEKRFNKTIIPLGAFIVGIAAIGSFLVFMAVVDSTTKKYEAVNNDVKSLRGMADADKASLAEVELLIGAAKGKLELIKSVSPDVAAQIGTHEQRLTNIDNWIKAKDAAASAPAAKSQPSAKQAAVKASAP